MTSATLAPVTPEGARESRPPRPLRSFWFHLLVGAGIGAIVAALIAIVFCVVAGVNAEATHPDPQERTAFLQSLGMAGLLMFASTFGPMGVLFGALTGAVVRIVRGALGERPVPDVPRGPHLTDAMIDARGDIYARGSIEPPPALGVRMPAGADLLRIGSDDDGNMTISPARARRDAATGYLDGKDFTPTITIGASLAAAIRTRVANPDWAQTPDPIPTVATLTTLGPLGASVAHALSDVRCHVEAQGGSAVVEIEAALADAPREPTRRAADDPDPRRIMVRFSVDRITRVVALAGIEEDTGDPSRRPPVVPRSLHAPQLATAPLGTYGEIYGVSADGWLRNVRSFEPRGPRGWAGSLSIGGSRPNFRHRSGLIVNDTHFYPRLDLVGVSLGAIVAALRTDSGELLFETAVAFDVDTRTEDTAESPSSPAASLGSVELARGGSGGWGPSARFRSTYVRAVVEDSGLVIEYRCETEHQTFCDDFVIPWEVLTLRVPGLRAHREALLAPVPSSRIRRARS
ncbi:hypothetical protein GCM10027515_07150 [Schumannella luteola]|uniref:Uncharacterized protein n=1 Tax=Schumannella luteola TaxID=472059 RepID=A0A852YA50_9MICO|nr:hypothetical protein [Schumannella luteola]NYG98154.1 hypothetical protein [Schumannella luteola]TPX01871.1 hypothetical protein FJ656_26165 [Schumannella luteola]